MSSADHDDDESRAPSWSMGVELSAVEVTRRVAMLEIETQIQDSGWALVGQHQDAKCGGAGTWTYTIGLHRRGLPEIMTHGLCGCSDVVVNTIARRQLKAGAFEDSQITQIEGTPVRLDRWAHDQHLRLLVEYYRHFSDAPTLLLVSPL